MLAEPVGRATVLSPRVTQGRRSSAARLAASAGTASLLQHASGGTAGNPNLWNISVMRDEAKLQVWNPDLSLFPNWRTGDLFWRFIETESHKVLIWIRELRRVQSLAFGLGPVPNHSWLWSDYSALLVQFIHLAASVLLLCCYVYLASFTSLCPWSGILGILYLFMSVIR